MSKNEIYKSVKNYVHEMKINGIIRFLVIDNGESGKDVDIFLEINESVNRFDIIKVTSCIAVKLTSEFNILVSIYPVYKTSIQSELNQFFININKKSKEF